MHVPHLATAVSALPLAALLLLGPAGQAQALECGPGLAPAVVNGTEICAPTQYSPGDAAPSYNPGESYYNPETGEYHEAVPAVPIPAEPSAAPAQVPTTAAPEPATPAPAPAPAGGPEPAPAPVVTPSPSTTTSSTPTPSPESADTERTSLVLPAVAAVVILGLLAGTLLLRHRNRRSRG
ncbi:hypothetical protein MUK71_04755 [Arthrobacter zhangbolii]|uniref:Gram-positive cocci surface proteins LPxTG domain-containing protein n=1 Tax=Arthrobacter zhangbolii TaxID=2886936 RepID=A0A9X1SA21_9MICC|nr:hypothetical protein [Arthrobacter zhangbolii]MCC3272892.1 hypothetical protein [Arthrobacter zhangbolii]MCC3295226.1 hypothetical protein [Arthrobacter zhangbolii]UON93751.1 hypothetical protein MUK71_04755 [Arthrobacter zhangbolii]